MVCDNQRRLQCPFRRERQICIRDRAQSPRGIGPTPADIADAVGFLMGARAVTGQVLFVDSGERFLARSRDVLFETERL